jgi:hypothetical protein
VGSQYRLLYGADSARASGAWRAGADYRVHGTYNVEQRGMSGMSGNMSAQTLVQGKNNDTRRAH